VHDSKTSENKIPLPRSTQPGHPSLVRCNSYQPKSGDALQTFYDIFDLIISAQVNILSVLLAVGVL